jgi:hypothetical protein
MQNYLLPFTSQILETVDEPNKWAPDIFKPLEKLINLLIVFWTIDMLLFIILLLVLLSSFWPIDTSAHISTRLDRISKCGKIRS